MSPATRVDRLRPADRRHVPRAGRRQPGAGHPSRAERGSASSADSLSSSAVPCWSASATWCVAPESFVFFGILHEIALASVLALPFLRTADRGVVGLAAAVVVALPYFFSSPVFDPSAALVGGPVGPRAALGGLRAGLPLVRRGAGRHRRRPRSSSPTSWTRRLPAGARPIRSGRAAVWAGRWSLAIYLIHQPLLYGLFSSLRRS